MKRPQDIPGMYKDASETETQFSARKVITGLLLPKEMSLQESLTTGRKIMNMARYGVTYQEDTSRQTLSDLVKEKQEKMKLRKKGYKSDSDTSDSSDDEVLPDISSVQSVKRSSE